MAAALHIFSPAGVVLSAPYTESLFGLLSFAGTGLLLYGIRAPCERRNSLQDLFVLAAGGVLGLATTTRSNGLFSGLMIAYEFTLELYKLFRTIPSFSTSFPIWRRLISLGFAGIFVGAGFAIPQVIAFFDLCKKDSNGRYQRAWCNSRPLPSIYTWVQKHYW